MESVLVALSMFGVATSLAMLNYRYSPAVISGSAALGLLPLPDSMAWVGSPVGFGGGLAATAAALMLDRLAKRPGDQHIPRSILRGAGIPVAMATVLAVTLGAAERQGVEAHVLGNQASAVLETRQYGVTDMLLITAGTIGATLGIVLGRMQRAVIGGISGLGNMLGIPGTNIIRSGVTITTLLLAAIVARLPLEVRLGLLGVAVAGAVVVALALRARLHVFGAAWQRTNDGTRRAIALAELAVPGSGFFVSGQRVVGVGRLLLAGLVVFVGMGAAGLLAIPIYAWIGLGGAIALLRQSQDIRPPTQDFRPAPISSAALAIPSVSRDLDWYGTTTGDVNRRDEWDW